MRIKIIAVGKLKDKYFAEAVKEYEKRLSRFCKLEITELQDLKNPDLSSEALCLETINKEGRDILSKIKNEFVVALCIEGKKMSSEAFSKFIQDTTMKTSDITFVIGGSLGLSEEVKKRADYKLSLSDMTFPHGLSRVILLEQIYRGFKIAAGENYHK